MRNGKKANMTRNIVNELERVFEVKNTKTMVTKKQINILKYIDKIAISLIGTTQIIIVVAGHIYAKRLFNIVYKLVVDLNFEVSKGKLKQLKKATVEETELLNISF